MPTTKTVVNRLQQTLHKVQNVLISKFVAFQEPNCTFIPEYIDGTWYLKPQPIRRVRLINILSRALYSEFHRFYPIADLRDLQQVLAHSFDSQTFHQLGPSMQGGRQVISYQVAADFFTKNRFLAFWIPISFILSKGYSESGFTAEIQSENPWYLASFSQHSYSQIRNAVTNNLAVFRLTQGVPDGLPHYELNNQQCHQKSIQHLGKIKPQDWLTFSCFNSNQMAALPWRPYAMVLGVTAVLYMATASLVLEWQGSARVAAIEALGKDLNALLSKQEQLARLQADVQSLTLLQEQKIALSPTWLLVNQLNEMDVTILDLSQRKLVLNIRGQTLRATDVLTQLRQHPLIESADFSAPVIKNQGKDEFTMRVELKAGSINAT